MTDEERVLGSRYEVGELIGYGGMAEVHKGRDLRLGRDVAIKMLRTDLARDPTFQARFRREAQNAASLNHPAIVAVYDTGEEKGADGEALPYIVMEFVSGRTLKEVLTAEGPLPPKSALEITADACSALEFSHRHGIIHRDIKPGNIMLTDAGQVKVMDFGIARAVASTTTTMTQTSAVIGTAQYLSPEQARGETVDARSDVYATGCVLFELLTGQPPFTGDSPVSVAYQHVREEPKPPSQRNPDVPPDVDSVVLKALAKNPANRYQSAAEMRADMLRAANGRPVLATPPPPQEGRTQVLGAAGGAGGDTGTQPAARVTDPARRRRAVWVLVSLALLVVLGVAAVGIGLYLSSDHSAKAVLPNVKGKPTATAIKTLNTAGFRHVEQRTAKSTKAQRGKVIEQVPTPEAKKEIPTSTQVTLTIGSGPKTVKVPDVTGFTREAAKSTLQLQHLKARFTEVDSDSPKGTVVDTDPAAGSVQAVETTVTVHLSKGNETKVPSVVGKMQSEAEQQLGNAGFKVKVLPDNDSDAKQGTVTSQTPNGGDTAIRDSTVTITVATGKSASPSPTGSASASPSETPSPSPSDTLFPTGDLPGGGGGG
ncbi:serine/threonine protein kinase [Actinocatenispora thailandica]|uniref:non-specific serine/threonine protein kinase n=1 Tax=Actinocatenispora thailandica TaxID=227318 RepID=A0A7R7DVT4_9ACTN|nr:Stk1 family PASTA domain-containing Ser/Thr kinase [Actinocatenispora thailandica]BCJ38803.1 serine/threonine protein kinase [Actinocatenispora thailandica]